MTRLDLASYISGLRDRRRLLAIVAVAGLIDTAIWATAFPQALGAGIMSHAAITAAAAFAASAQGPGQPKDISLATVAVTAIAFAGPLGAVAGSALLLLPTRPRGTVAPARDWLLGLSRFWTDRPEVRFTAKIRAGRALDAASPAPIPSALLFSSSTQRNQGLQRLVRLSSHSSSDLASTLRAAEHAAAPSVRVAAHAVRARSVVDARANVDAAVAALSHGSRLQRLAAARDILRHLPALERDRASAEAALSAIARQISDDKDAERIGKPDHDEQLVRAQALIKLGRLAEAEHMLRRLCDLGVEASAPFLVDCPIERDAPHELVEPPSLLLPGAGGDPNDA